MDDVWHCFKEIDRWYDDIWTYHLDQFGDGLGKYKPCFHGKSSSLWHLVYQWLDDRMDFLSWFYQWCRMCHQNMSVARCRGGFHVKLSRQAELGCSIWRTCALQLAMVKLRVQSCGPMATSPKIQSSAWSWRVNKIRVKDLVKGATASSSLSFSSGARWLDSRHWFMFTPPSKGMEWYEPCKPCRVWMPKYLDFLNPPFQQIPFQLYLRQRRGLCKSIGTPSGRWGVVCGALILTGGAYMCNPQLKSHAGQVYLHQLSMVLGISSGYLTKPWKMAHL